MPERTYTGEAHVEAEGHATRLEDGLLLYQMRVGYWFFGANQRPFPDLESSLRSAGYTRGDAPWA